MNEINVGMQVYCDLHHKSKLHTVTGLDLKNGWAFIDRSFHWPIRSCFPFETSRRCAVCKRPVYSGFLFDEKTCLCDKHCATKFFDNDAGCVEILIDEGERLIWHEEFESRTHYRANVNHHHTDCFHHFDNEARMFAWISERIGEQVHSFEDCDAWTKKQATSPAHCKGYIEILYIKPKEFYDERRAYVMKLRECEDIMAKAQRTRNDKRLKRLLVEYSFAYDDANWYWGVNPAVWQGEI